MDAPNNLTASGIGIGGVEQITPALAFGFEPFTDLIRCYRGGFTWDVRGSATSSVSLFGNLFIWIDLVKTSHVFNVYVNSSSTKPTTPQLTVNGPTAAGSSLATYLGNQAYLSFGSASVFLSGAPAETKNFDYQALTFTSGTGSAVPITGTATYNLGALTYSGAGTFTADTGISGGISYQLGSLVYSGAGTQKIIGSGSYSLNPLTYLASSNNPTQNLFKYLIPAISAASLLIYGDQQIEGTGNLILKKIMISGVGVKDGSQGSGSISLKKLVILAQGQNFRREASLLILKPIAVSGIGKQSIKASGNYSLNELALSAIGKQKVKGSGTALLSGLDFAAAGAMTSKGRINLRLLKVSYAGEGKFFNKGQALYQINVGYLASGKQRILGESEFVLSTLSYQASVRNLAIGSGEVELGSVQYSGEGQHPFTAWASFRVQKLLLSGEGELQHESSGEFRLRRLQYEGYGVVPIAAQANVTLNSVLYEGKGKQKQRGRIQYQISGLTYLSQGKGKIRGSGSLVLKKLILDGDFYHGFNPQIWGVGSVALKKILVVGDSKIRTLNRITVVPKENRIVVETET